MQLFKRCQEILDNFQRYVIGIALIAYLTLIVFTMVIVFILYYAFTKDKHYKCKNAYSSASIVLFAATFIPIFILHFYCCYKTITLEQFFGANFDKCFNIGKSLQSVEVINDERPNRRINEKENDYDNVINYNKENPLNTNNINNNIDKNSERSNKGMIQRNNL